VMWLIAAAMRRSSGDPIAPRPEVQHVEG